MTIQPYEITDFSQTTLIKQKENLITHDYTWIGNNIENEHIDDTFVWMLLIQNIAENLFRNIYNTLAYTFWTHIKILINSRFYKLVSK